MKKVIGLLILALFSVNASSAEMAVLDFRAALLQSKAGQQAAQAPRAQVDKMRARLEQENGKLKEMIDAVTRDELTLAPEDLAKRRQEVNQKQSELRGMFAAMQQQAQQMEQKLIHDLTPKGEVALKKIIEERKLDVVISRQAVIYNNDAVDITAELIKKLDEEK